MEILAALGGLVVLWWLVGVYLFTCINLYVAPGTPWGVRIMSAAVSGFVLPWLVIMTGRLPKGGIIATQEDLENPPPEMLAHMRRKCQCPSCRGCRAARGEEEDE